ncbi:MAG: hypothetical protein Q9N34_02400 [Aquificota bacterium]|nr:hypothetical protein [Aquificota bacterium]
MRGKALIATALVGAILPFALNKYYNSLCPELPKGLVVTETAKAMPSFSRQTGFSCGTCHTMPPRLNAYGRVFKMRGYTEGKAIGSIPMGEGETVLKYNPVAVRLLTYPYSKKRERTGKLYSPMNLWLPWQEGCLRT